MNGPIKYSEITAALETIMRAGEERGSRPSAWTNVIVVPPPEESRETERWIQLIASINPSRIFLLRPSFDSDSTRAEVTTINYAVSPDSEVSSELVTLFYRASDVSALRSVIHGNIVPGSSVEMLLFDPSPPLDEFRGIVESLRAIYFDAERFEQPFEVIGKLLGRGELVDLQWIRLSAWREQVHRSFERIWRQDPLKSLNQVEIVGAELRTLFFAGWILYRLGFEPVSYSPSGFECRKGTQALQVALTFEDDPDRWGVLWSGEELDLLMERRGEILFTELKGPSPFQMSSPADIPSPEEAFRRYFLVGESNVNYEGAFRLASELRRLLRAFS
jgi:hypothetical protein